MIQNGSEFVNKGWRGLRGEYCFLIFRKYVTVTILLQDDGNVEIRLQGYACIKLEINPLLKITIQH